MTPKSKRSKGDREDDDGELLRTPYRYSRMRTCLIACNPVQMSSRKSIDWGGQACIRRKEGRGVRAGKY